MKVLVADRIADEGVGMLRDAGYDVDVIVEQSEEELVSRIPGYDALIVRSHTQASRPVIEAGRNLRVIGRAGVWLDNVDVPCATEHGIIICNTPTAYALSAAEHAFALMLACVRHVPQAHISMHDGRWERSSFLGSEMCGKTLAVIGFGHIGTLVAARARAFGMNVIVYDPYCASDRAQAAGVVLYGSIDEVCAEADIISVHLPRTDEVEGMFGTHQYALMKEGVYLINSACGGVFDLQQMVPFLENGKIAGAAFDVFDKEPCTDSVLHRFENVVLTPHIGASTVEAQNRAGTQIADYVMRALGGKMVPTAVNVAPVPAEVMEAVGPYIPACETVGHIIGQIIDGDIGALCVNAYGVLATQDVSVLPTAALGGIFSETGSPANLVNAAYLAEQKSVNVHVRTLDVPIDYAGMVDLVARQGTREVEVACTVSIDDEQTRIVSIDGYKLDFVPGTNLMVLVYEDKPGRLGQIGTIMGNAGINIETLELSDAKKNGKDDNRALVVFNVDGPVPAHVKDELEQALALDAGYYIDL